jgi:hypothetical protein
MTNSHASEPLSRVQKIGICSLLLLCIIYGAYVELRGALQQEQKTDVGVYLRAAWAVRTGTDIYSITNSRGWHYVYPPLFAIMMAPLADPPPGMDREGYIPYAVSLGLWYVLTLIMGFSGVHILAKALEETSGDPAIRGQPMFCQRWWALRILPVLILLIAIGRAQMRGQVDLLIAFLFCGAAAALLRRRRLRAGLWLSAAVCIKMIPAFLLLLPAWRRDWRMLSGCFIGLVFGLIVIPVIAMGPDKVFAGYQDLYKQTVLASITGDTKGSRHVELTGITSTDSNAPMVVIHNIVNPVKNTRPEVAANSVRMAHWIIAIVLMIITLFSAGWKGSGRWFSGRVQATSREQVFFGALLLTMLIASPVFHPHYVSMAIPLVTVLLSVLWDKYLYPHIPSVWKVLFWSLVIGHLLTSIDRGIFWYLRDYGLVLLTTLSLWAGSIFMLRSTGWEMQTPVTVTEGKQRGNAA